MDQELIRNELHRTLERVIDQADEETLRFLIKKGEMALSKLLAEDEKRYCQVKGNPRVFEVKPVSSGTKNQQLRDCHEALIGGSNR